jgi:hypothetical protein
MPVKQKNRGLLIYINLRIDLQDCANAGRVDAGFLRVAYADANRRFVSIREREMADGDELRVVAADARDSAASR